MGLDWVASPHPETAEGESPGEYDYDPVFRAQALVDAELPDSLKPAAFEDMTPWEMRSYADELNTIRDTRDIDDDVAATVQDAVDWLRYWAEQGKSMYATY